MQVQQSTVKDGSKLLSDFKIFWIITKQCFLRRNSETEDWVPSCSFNEIKSVPLNIPETLTKSYAEENAGKGDHEQQVLSHPLPGVGGHLTGTLRGRDVLPAHLGEQILGESGRGLFLHLTRPPASGVQGIGASRVRTGRSRWSSQAPFSRSLAANGGAPAAPRRRGVAVLGVFR